MLAPFQKNKSLTFLVSLLLLILIFPFFESTRIGSILFVILFTSVLLSGVYAISYDVRYFAVGVLLVAPILVCRWSNIILNRPEIDDLSRICAAVFMGYTIIALLKRVLTSRTIGLDEIFAAVCAYVLIGTLFGFVYFLIERFHPGSFHFSAAPSEDPLAAFVYFSFAVLSTAGFGDITATLSFARALTVIEMILGVNYTAILIGRLISASLVKDVKAGETEKKESDREVRRLLHQHAILKDRPVGLVMACVMFNYVASVLMIQSHLPFFFDSCGTSLAVILGGFWAGAAAAVFYHLLIAATFWGWSSWVWTASSLLIAAVTWFFSKRGMVAVDRPGTLVFAGATGGFLNALLVQFIIWSSGMPPYEGTLAVYRFFLKLSGNGTFAAFAEKMFVEIADKTISIMIAAVAGFLLHDFLERTRVRSKLKPGT